MISSKEYRERVESTLASLQVPPDFLASRALSLCEEAEILVIAEFGPDGREHLLVPAAADAWRAVDVAMGGAAQSVLQERGGLRMGSKHAES